MNTSTETETNAIEDTRLVSKHASEQHPDPDSLQPIEFGHVDILFAGLLAKAYSDGFYFAPMQNWAKGLAPRDLDIGGHVVRMTEGRRVVEGREVGGVSMTINWNYNAPGDKSQTHYFFPFSCLADVKLTVRGVLTSHNTL